MAKREALLGGPSTSSSERDENAVPGFVPTLLGFYGANFDCGVRKSAGRSAL